MSDLKAILLTEAERRFVQSMLGYVGYSTRPYADAQDREHDAPTEEEWAALMAKLEPDAPAAVAFTADEAFKIGMAVQWAGHLAGYTKCEPGGPALSTVAEATKLLEGKGVVAIIHSRATRALLEGPPPTLPAAIEGLIDAAEEAAAMLSNACDSAIYDGDEPADAPERIAVDEVAIAVMLARAAAVSAPAADTAYFALVAAILRQRQSWDAMCSGADEENTTPLHESAGEVVETLDGILKEVGAEPLRVLVAIDGGNLSGVVTDVPMSVTLIDYDTDGDDDPESVVEVPQGDGRGTETARRGGEEPEVNPAFIDMVLALPTDSACLALDDEAEAAEIADETKWLASARLGIPGPDGGEDSYAGYFAAATAEEATAAATRLIEHIYVEGVRIFEMTLTPPAATKKEG